MSLAGVTHSVEYAVHSLISFLAKLKISAHHGAKASSTMPGIFFCSRSDIALPERALRASPLPASLHYAVTSSRVSTPCPGVALAKTDPLAAPRQNTPGCAISLLISPWLAGAPDVAPPARQAFPRSIRLISPISPILRTPAPLHIKLR